MPTSVLLAVLAAAGLLALAPALVRRYDATERLVAERALSTARVLARAGARQHRRRRTVPGRRPVNPPRVVSFVDSALHAVELPRAGGPVRAGRRSSAARAPRQLRHPREVYRRRRVFAALLVLNTVELIGVWFVGPGFWMGTAVSGLLLVGYMVHLRNRALTARRQRAAEARYVAWVASRQAAVRRVQARRAAARKELLRQELLERERVRRETARNTLRGRPYEARGIG